MRRRMTLNDHVALWLDEPRLFRWHSETDSQVEAARLRWLHRLKTRVRNRYEAEKRSLRPVVVRSRAAYGRRRGHARLG